MQAKGKIRYYDTREYRPYVAPAKVNFHSEFLRTGRISRAHPIWVPEERRYLTYQEVAERTGRKLEAAGDESHKRINGFHQSIRLPKLIFHRTLDENPHLGYCHVTAASTFFSRNTQVRWSFYIANFFSEIGDDEHFFERINPDYSRMYFAVAIEGDPGEQMQIDRSIRRNGILFRTSDPKEALKNVLMLGAPDETVRAIIKKL